MFPDYFRDDVFRLETQRLWLRWPTAADAPLIEKLAGEREIAEFTARIPHPYPRGRRKASCWPPARRIVKAAPCISRWR